MAPAVSAVVGWAAVIGFGIAMNLPHLWALGILAAAALIWAIVMTISLLGSLPIGIRVDGDGIRMAAYVPGSPSAARQTATTQAARCSPARGRAPASST